MKLSLNEKKAQGRKLLGYPIFCSTCLRVFYPRADQAAEFCSPKCCQVARKIRMAFEALERRLDRPLRTCEQCRKEYLPQRLKKHSRFCSRKCVGKSKQLRTAEQFQRFYKAKLARYSLHLAVKAGKVTREPCFFCGSEKDIHAHHTNYDLPLDVTWLCRPCHNQIHTLS